MQNLPEPVAAYFAADPVSVDAVVACFAPNATVLDEHQTFEGHQAIRQWKTDASSKYDYSVEPFNAVTNDATTVVTAHVTGNFPGSPVDLRYTFLLNGDAIEHLEIAA